MPIQIKERIMYDITDLELSDIKIIYSALENWEPEDNNTSDQREALLKSLQSLMEG
jgi:hypothetical protein